MDILIDGLTRELKSGLLRNLPEKEDVDKILSYHIPKAKVVAVWPYSNTSDYQVKRVSSTCQAQCRIKEKVKKLRETLKSGVPFGKSHYQSVAELEIWVGSQTIVSRETQITNSHYP